MSLKLGVAWRGTTASSALPPAEQEYTAQLVQVDEVTIDRFQILDGNEPVNLAVMTDNDVLEISRNHNVMIIRMDLKHLIQSAQYVNGDHIGFYTENDVFPLTNDKAYALKQIEPSFQTSNFSDETKDYAILQSLCQLRGLKAMFYYRFRSEPLESNALNLAIRAGIPIYGEGKPEYVSTWYRELYPSLPSNVYLDLTASREESELTGGMWFDDKNYTPQALKYVYDQLKSLYVTEYVTTIPDIDSVRHCSLDLRSEDGTIALVGSGQILFPSRLHLATPSDRVKPQRLAQNPNLAAAQQKQQEASSEGEAAEQTSQPTTPTAPTTQPTTAPTTVTPPADAAYILPFSATRLVTEQDIAHLSVDQLELARNEIYARHGRQFRTEHIQEYFNRQPWYRGTIAPDRFNQNSLFNDVEKANVEFMLEYENKKRGR